eukprot:CAMPEP_0172756972 /NCGR_PEP_ID=MMETSP1074-20121228/162848_1 /TAXON_ID=2916 /ORGANISM="Ceratium fusus, Strain PA161109" /LENGTH=66 /DNA_ID=CAMNT_0013590325 /DNA_START=75 /DNA_END=271 /DNA_ORIENTATION=-
MNSLRQPDNRFAPAGDHSCPERRKSAGVAQQRLRKVMEHSVSSSLNQRNLSSQCSFYSSSGALVGG